MEAATTFLVALKVAARLFLTGLGGAALVSLVALVDFRGLVLFAGGMVLTFVFSLDTVAVLSLPKASLLCFVLPFGSGLTGRDFLGLGLALGVGIPPPRWACSTSLDVTSLEYVD